MDGLSCFPPWTVRGLEMTVAGETKQVEQCSSCGGASTFYTTLRSNRPETFTDFKQSPTFTGFYGLFCGFAV